MAPSDFSFCKSRSFPRWSLWSGGRGVTPPPPMVYGHSNTSLPSAPPPPPNVPAVPLARARVVRPYLFCPSIHPFVCLSVRISLPSPLRRGRAPDLRGHRPPPGAAPARLHPTPHARWWEVPACNALLHREKNSSPKRVLAGPGKAEGRAAARRRSGQATPRPTPRCRPHDTRHAEQQLQKVTAPPPPQPTSPRRIEDCR